MNSFLIFTIKELKEQIMTFKGLVIFFVLLIFGMSSPLMAKLTPELLKMIGSGGIEIKIPVPTYIDAYTQFFKNVSQIVIIIVVLIFSNGVVAETYKGTCTMILTKRLSRSSFILSKFFSYCIVWTVSYCISAALCFCYTVYLFPGGKPENLLFSFLCMWLFGVTIISAAVFASTVFKNFPLAAAAGFCIWCLISLSSSIHKIREYTPAALQEFNIGLIEGQTSPGFMKIPVLTGILLTVLFLVFACFIFRRREL